MCRIPTFPWMEVVCLNKNGEEKHLSIRELLPYGFDQTWLVIDEPKMN